MARYTGPVCRMCRVEQKKLMLKGNRCKSDKCPMNKKRPAPGKDPKSRAGKRSDYGVQLREKQKLKRIYGMLEKQFSLFFKRALRMPGITGENLFRHIKKSGASACTAWSCMRKWQENYHSLIYCKS